MRLIALVLVGMFYVAPVAGKPLGRQSDAYGTVKTSSITPNVRDLHPAFILTPKRIDAAIKRGQKMAKEGKTQEDIDRINAQLPRGIKGEKGRSHESRVTCKSLDAAEWIAQAYRAATVYEPFKADENILRDGTYLSAIEFEVELVSMPRARWAEHGDVDVEKFVLTDDQGQIIKPLEALTTEPVYQGTVTRSGVTAVSETVDATTVALATTTSVQTEDGKTTTSTTTGEATTTQVRTEYKPWSADYPYYSAKYTVRFPLFGPNGNPLVTRDTKKLTLHIITGTGERIAEYKLSPPKE